ICSFTGVTAVWPATVTFAPWGWELNVTSCDVPSRMSAQPLKARRPIDARALFRIAPDVQVRLRADGFVTDDRDRRRIQQDVDGLGVPRSAVGARPGDTAVGVVLPNPHHLQRTAESLVSRDVSGPVRFHGDSQDFVVEPRGAVEGGDVRRKAGRRVF